MKPTLIDRFVRRLERIGIIVDLSMNYPWVYLTHVNGVPVDSKFQSKWGFTGFFVVRGEQWSDRREVFKQIRDVLTNQKAIAYVAKFYAVDEHTAVRLFKDEVQAVIKLCLTSDRSRTVNNDDELAESVRTFLIGKRTIKQDLTVGLPDDVTTAISAVNTQMDKP